MDVADEFQRVRILLDEDGAIAALEEVPGAAQPAIGATCVAAGKRTQEARQWIRMILDHHVHVIAHPAIGMQPVTATLDARGQQ